MLIKYKFVRLEAVFGLRKMRFMKRLVNNSLQLNNSGMLSLNLIPLPTSFVKIFGLGLSVLGELGIVPMFSRLKH